MLRKNTYFLLTYVLLRVIILPQARHKGADGKIKYSELEKILKDAGCEIVREGKNHTLWRNPKTGKAFPVPRHKTQDVPTGTYKSIMKSAGLL